MNFKDTLQSSCHFRVPIDHSRIVSYLLAHCCFCYDCLQFPYYFQKTLLTLTRLPLLSPYHFQAPISHQSTQISLYSVGLDLVFLELLIFLLLQSPYRHQAPIRHLKTILLQLILCLLNVDFLRVYYYFQKALLTVIQYPPLNSYRFQAPISHLRMVSFQISFYSVGVDLIFLNLLTYLLLQSSYHFQAPISYLRTVPFQLSSLYSFGFDIYFLDHLIYLLPQSSYHFQAPINHWRSLSFQVTLCCFSVNFVGFYYYFQSSYHFLYPINHLRTVLSQLDSLYSVVFD